MAFPCQKQTPSSFRFLPYIQHGKSGRSLVISLELQHCRGGVRAASPFTHNAAFLLMNSCIPVVQEKSVTGGATWGRKHLAWGLWSCELQTHSRGKPGPSKVIKRLCKTGICYMMMLLQSWWYCLTQIWLPFKSVWNRTKVNTWTGFAEGWEEKEIWVGSVSSLPQFAESQNVPASKQTDSLGGNHGRCFWGPHVAKK